jgi:DNA-binding transcriptional MerR regulator
MTEQNGRVEYRVSELARAAGTSVRNVRVYQDRGLLPPPRRQGRIGLYDESHLTRLRLIGRLLARGWTFATIGELFEAWGRGRDLAESLGLRDLPPGPVEEPARLTRAELAARLGGRFPPAAIERAVELGLMVPLGPAGAAYAVPAPDLPSAAARLSAAGIGADEMLDLVAAIEPDLTRIARRVARTLAGPAGLDEETEGTPERVERLRPPLEWLVEALLRSAVRQELDRAPD